VRPAEGPLPHRRGRQREARRNDGSLLAAARLVVAMEGPSASVSAIAEEAGVGIGSLYRRYPTKVALLARLCGESLDEQVRAAEAALAAGGGGLFAFIRACVGFRAGVFTSIAGGIDLPCDLAAKAQHAHELVQLLVAQGCSEHAVRPDLRATDVHQLIEIFSRRRRDMDYERLLEVTIDGMRSLDGAQLPPSTVTWHQMYADRWGREG
jgi:AcrR family transcriptional regulator